MQEQGYANQIDLLFEGFNIPVKNMNLFTNFLNKNCIDSQEHTLKFLRQLNARNIEVINFNTWRKQMRILKKLVKKLKKPQLQLQLATYLNKCCQKYFPHYIRPHNQNAFQQFLAITKSLAFGQPDLKKQKQIILYLQDNQNEAVEKQIVEIINTTVLVDKKNTTFDSLHMNKFFTPFVVRNVGSIMPQLERLLVRSSSNIEVWLDFFTSLSPIFNFDQQIVETLKIIKTQFHNFPQVCIPLVSILTSHIKDEKICEQVLNFLTSMITAQHQAKKKLTLVQMLKGTVNSIKQFRHYHLSNQIMITLINSWAKFTEEEQFKKIMQILDELLPSIRQPNQAIAQAFKPSLKSANKLLLTVANISMFMIFKKKEDFQLPSVADLFNHYKGQFFNLHKKMQANWQWMVHIIGFLSNNDSQYFQYLDESSPIFKQTTLSLERLEKKAIIHFILNMIEQQQKSDQQTPQYVYMAITVILESTRDKQFWQILKSFSSKSRINILSKGIYPMIWYKSPKALFKNSQNFKSLTNHILRLQNWKISLQDQSCHRILALCSHFQSHSINFIDEINEQKIDKGFKLAVYNYEADQKYFPNLRQQKICEDKAVRQISLKYTDLIHKSIDSLLKQENFTKNFDILVQFQESLSQQIKEYNKEMQSDKVVLQQQGLYEQENLVQRKVFAADFNIRMMSEDQVKAQKLHHQYMKMLYYYQKILRLITKSAKTSRKIEVLSQIWKRHFNGLVHAASFPGHQHPLLKFIRTTCTQFYIDSSKQRKQDAHIFYQFSQFLGQFFVMKGAGKTPSVPLMEKCQKFLRQALVQGLQQYENDFIFLFFNDISEYILENMQFDINLKKLSVQFFNICVDKNIKNWNPAQIYGFLVKNINILSSCEGIKKLLAFCAQKVDSSKYTLLFDDILNYIYNTKKLIIEVMSEMPQFKPQFEDYIKLKILELQNSKEIQELSAKILSKENTYSKSITNFNMKKFINKNSKQTIEKLCQFIKQCMTPQLVKPIFQMVLSTSLQLYQDQFDQEGLQFFPYFLSLNIQYIEQPYFKPIFDLIVMHYSSNPHHATLSKQSIGVGIQIIKKFAPNYSAELLKVLESYINRVKGISNILFLGVLAPYLQNSSSFQMVEKRITDIFIEGDAADQKAISKCIPDLMSFFKQPELKVKSIFQQIGQIEQKKQVGQAYLCTGLLKGISPSQTLYYLDKLLDKQYPSKKTGDKTARLCLLLSFIANFGRVIETRANQILDIIIALSADTNQKIRDQSKSVAQGLILKMSSFCVKKILPHLLDGLQNEQNWRIKISYIWILGIMAHSSARQLQSSLPQIVPTLSACLSNAHPIIKQKAAQAMGLIGQTIKNPQISNSVDILIDALENPFEKSEKALEILLKTRFAHFIDPPSLSLVVPIVDYCLRGRSSDLKAGACQVMGSICELIQNPNDLLPYLKLITGGLKIALCDPLSQIRSIASMAIGRISGKVGSRAAEQYFHFVTEIIESANSNTTQRQGAAQAYSEIICSQDFDYFEESLNRIFDKLNSAKHSQKEGFILVFLYVPGIRKNEFQIFIKQVNSNMYGFVSDQDENIRNSAMQVQKVLINNYCLTHTDLLLDPLCEGVFDSNWRKRNAALILIGEMLNIIKSYEYNNKSKDKNYAYYQGIMAVYVLKDDQLEMPRATANLVWNTYIENTPKTIKSGMRQLVKMWTRFTHSANGLIFKNIVGFSGKYGQNFFFEILEILQQLIDDQIYRKGVFDVLSEFIKRLTQQFLSKDNYKKLIRQFYDKFVFTASDEVRETLARSMSIYVQKMKEQTYFEQLIYPQIDRMKNLTELDDSYMYALHLIRDFLKTSVKSVVDRLIGKIVEQPLTDFKIEVITNNADRVANKLYSLYKVPATNILLEQIFVIADKKEHQSRYKLIVYCLNQVSVYLTGKNKSSYITLLTDHIRKLAEDLRANQNPQNQHRNLIVLDTFLNMVFYFLGSTPLEEIEDLENLIADITGLLKRGSNISQVIHKIFLILVSDDASDRTVTYYKQLIVSMENNLSDMVIWSNQDIFENYLKTLVKGIAYGANGVMVQCIKMIQFMIGKTEQKIIRDNMPRILGPIIRVGNYQIIANQKIDILNFIHDVNAMGYPINMYTFQITTLCFRLIQELRNNPEITKKSSTCLLDLLKGTNDKRSIIHTLLSKCKTGNNNETAIVAMYHLVKSIINQNPDLISKSLYEIIHHDLTALLHSTEIKSSLKTQYYSSKTAARIGAHLGHKFSHQAAKIEAVTCSYQTLLYFLNFAYYAKEKLQKNKQIELFIKDSSRQKVFYLLKSIKLCNKCHDENKNNFSHAYVQSLVPETLSGFDDIIEMLDCFEQK